MASKLILIIVSVFDIIAFGLAIAAEQRKSTATIYTDLETNYCVYKSDIATGYGVGALLFLMASQVIIMVASRCFCCGKALSRGGSRTWAIVLFVASWLAFAIAEFCLVGGSATNARHTKYSTLYGDQLPSCEMLRKGVFATGAAFIVVTGIFTELYYVCYSKAKDGSGTNVGGNTGTGVVMGAYN